MALEPIHIMELGFAWHHSKIPKHARIDFEHMLECNCNSVLIAASENDLEYWYPNLIDIVDTAKDVGLKVWFNFWAFAGVFGGEPPSFFLHRNHHHRQITAESSEVVPAACINTTEFRSQFYEQMKRVIRDMKIDGIFLDEPHYFWTFDTAEFTCICETCKSLFNEKYGTTMPVEYNNQIEDFRKESMLDFLSETCRTIKLADSTTEVCVCVIPSEHLNLGTPDWEDIASLRDVDMFSSDPYYHVFGQDRKWAIETAKRTIKTAQAYGKKSQLWLQMFRLSEGEEAAVASLVPEYVELEIDSLFGWCYLANEGTVISSDRPKLLWDLVTKEYRRIT